jgi:TATA-binding protein-associated factor
LTSGSAHRMIVAATIVQEWATEIDRGSDTIAPLGKADDEAARSLTNLLIGQMESPAPATYSEMTTILTRIYAECQALLTAFSVEAKVSKDRIPNLPREVDPLSKGQGTFSLVTAQSAVGQHFDNLVKAMSKSAQKTTLPSLQDRRRKVLGSIGYFSIMKERYDVQVSCAVAGALVALRVMPSKFGPVVKALMDSVKVSASVAIEERAAKPSQKEESEILQFRAAASVAAFIDFTNTSDFTAKVNPSDKVVKNLFTFLCQDISVTPVFSLATEGIATLRDEKIVQKASASKDVPEETDEQVSARITRRGAIASLKCVAGRFGGRLFEAVPKFLEGISAALMESFGEGGQDRRKFC